ncbi:MAG: hypothetical protein IPM29_19075 [Planctomycetes bacterium]|nr:hypothetical protein [Planctomycetota bacterium]
MDAQGIERALTAALPLPHVARLVFELGRDGGGQKALRIWAVMADDAPATVWGPDARERIRDALRNALRGAGVRVWPYVAFRTAAEQAELDAGVPT